MNKITTKFKKNYFEQQAWSNNLLTCGLDEVGRGCLAGPVVVAATIIPQNTTYDLLQDSKILSQQDRITAYKWILQHGYSATVFVDHNIIQDINIYQATLYGMKKAYLQLMQSLPFSQEMIKYILVDAMPFSVRGNEGHDNLECYNFIKGEQLSTSIAAASIVAKVTRDQFIEQSLSKLFPGFNFEHHKGYATKQHYQALSLLGHTVIHRKTFLGNVIEEKNSQTTNMQQSLFERYT